MAVVEELLLIAKVVKAAYDSFQTIQSWLAPPDPATIRELYNRVVALEIDVARLTRDVENISYELRRAEAIEITRAVDAQRAAYTAALQYSIDHPGETSDEVAALSAALALASASFYMFPGRTASSPDRFDPRAALPSFLEAVNTWLALRKVNGSAWTPTSENALLNMASSLEGIIAKIRAAVVCIETYMSYDHPLQPPPRPPRIPRPLPPDPGPPPPAPPTEPRCHHDIACHDGMREETVYLLARVTKGYCGEDGSAINADQAKQYLDSYYMPDKLQAIADGWRALIPRP